MTMRWKNWFGALVALAVGFLLGWSVHPTPAASPTAVTVEVASPTKAAGEEKPKTASLMLDFGDGTVKTFPDVDVAKGPNLLEVMKNLSQAGNGFVLSAKPPGQYGVMVDQIGDKKNGDQGKYWLFWVNNVMAEKSADNTVLAPGDAVEWKFVNLKTTGQAQ
jgi:hypothetical protein